MYSWCELTAACLCECLAPSPNECNSHSGITMLGYTWRPLTHALHSCVHCYHTCNSVMTTITHTLPLYAHASTLLLYSSSALLCTCTHNITNHLYSTYCVHATSTLLPITENDRQWYLSRPPRNPPHKNPAKDHHTDLEKTKTPR